MTVLTEQLRRLREDCPDVALILDASGQIEQVYHDALEAMGRTHGDSEDVTNSAEVTISFHLEPSIQHLVIEDY